MRLLTLIHRLPCPPDGGSKLRAAAQLRYLARRHEVWCAGFVDGAGGRGARRQMVESMAGLRRICHDVAAVPLRRGQATARAMASLLAGSTATEGYFASAALRRRVRAWCSAIEFDAVLAFSSCMAPLALEVPCKRRVLDMDDLDSAKWVESAGLAAWPMSWLYRVEAGRLARRERQWLGAFDAGVLISRREASLVAEPALARRLHVIGPAIPEDLEQQLTGIAGGAGDGVTLPADPVVGFVGAMDYGPNVDAAGWFAGAVWPRVLQCRRDAAWWLVGRSPARKVRRLAGGTNVHVTGTVPDVGAYLSRMRVSVAPLRLARGVQIKVLMSMAAGRPCVVTSPVAAGIGAQAGRDLLVADAPEPFARAVVDLLNDTPRAEEVARAGRAFVMNKSRRERALARLESLLAGEPAGDEAEVSTVRAAGAARTCYCRLPAAAQPGMEVVGACG